MTTENMTTTGNDVTPKLLDVSAIPLIKHDILHNVKDSIDAIRDSITDEYKKELYDEIEKIKDDFENTSLEDKLELLDKIKALQDKQSTASEAIDALKQSVIRLEEGTDDDGNQSSVLDPEEITLLMKAALIEESFWTEDMIGAPSVLGKQIIGLVGLFGKIKASNIEGDLISGKTLQSYDKTKLVSGTQYENFDAESNTLGIETADGTTKGPAWQLRQDGDGYLAAGRISWDADGDVTLTGVKMSFNELVDVPDFTDGISIYTSTIFLRSNEEPAVPEGGSFSDPLPRISINNGIIWEDGIPEGDGVLWTSTRIFASDFTSDKNQSTWSEPRKLADDIDFEVIYGVEGANLGDLPTPEHVKENEGMKDYNGWYDEDKDAALQIIYMATSKKSEGKWSPWSISKIKGEDGQSINIVGIYQTLDQFKEEIAGPDLNNVPENVSYCYIVANDLYVWNITLQLWENIGRFNGKDGIDAVSTFKSTVFKRSEIDLTSADRPEGGSWKDPIPEGWEDGIPEGTGAIWMSHRTFYDKGNDEYNELSFWSIPKKMIDTQSFEVIYGVEGADLDHAQLPTPEYVKQYEGLVNYNGWYDEDTNVPEDKEIWYMATAKNDNGKWSKWNISKIKGEKGGDGKSVSIFGSFDTLEEFQTRIAGINLDIRPDDISAAYVVAGDLYVWVENVGRWMNVGKFAGKDGKDAVSKYKSIVYKRSSKDLTAEDKPVGGIWEDAVPEGWFDGIPSGEGAIWMSCKIIYSDNSMNESTEWSIPEKMIDSQTFEVIYGTENANRNKLPKLPISEGLADTENGWYDNEYSVPAGEEIWYMATAKCDNNKWGDWSVAKIKGESGKDGRSIQIKEYFATLEEFKAIAGDDLNRKPDDISYCYVVAGDLYVWDTGELRWENKGQFTGKDAVSQYKSTVYKRSKTDLTADDKPVGGNYSNPVPSGWEDGIPSGEGAIWSSYRMFYSDDNYTNNADWSIPKKMVDVAGQFEVIYGIEGAILQNTPKLPIEEGLKDDVNGWYDDDNLIPEGKDIWYMATATCKNGEWSTWTISKIKGESGDNGRSIQIKGYYETIDHFKEEIAGDNLDREPEDVSYCYIVSGDLYVWDGSENKWEYRGRFTGKDSVGQFKSTAFTRFIPTDEKLLPDLPEGGNWKEPWPDTEGWEDGIPEGDGPIWMSYRVFYSDEDHNKDTSWSEPKLMADSDGFEVIYGVKGANLDPDQLPTPEFVKKKEGVSNYNGTGWYDEAFDVPKEQEIWYMATSKKSEGKWSPWSISKIKGEDGTNGKSINIIQFYDKIEDFENNVDQDKAPNDPSDCYVVEGYLYVWDAGQNRWEQKGKFTGSDGASTYLHIKYAKNIEFDDLGGITLIDLTDEDGESSKDAIWMGIGYNDTLEDPMPSTGSDDIYKWTKIVADPIITPVKFKSMAFTRISISVSDDIIKTIIPTGGTYEKPIPDAYIGNGFGITWEDGIPKGEGDTKIWMTTATFYSDKDYEDPNIKVEWSKPRIMADVAGKFETAYGDSSVESNGNIDTSGLPKDDKGRANPDGKFNNGWVDEPINGGDYPYMATATFEKDSWSNWKVVKIKGEKGEKGAGIKYKDNVNTIEDLVFPPKNNEYDAAYIVKTNPEDDTDTQWNHLFAWTGIDYTPNEKHNKYKTDSGSWIYNGWSDTGQFNGRDGENGKTSYIYIKYAEHIEFDTDGNIDPTKCILGSNSGEKKDRWMGIGNGFDVLEPTLDTDDEENYSPDNWKKYNWIDLSNEDLTNELITLTLGTYNISAEHIAGKTIDTCVTGKDGDHTGKVELIKGTKFQEFEFVKNNEGKEEEQPKKDLTIAGENTEGPAWQLRKDGAGYLAAGNIRWDSVGNVEFGPEVTIGWNEEWDEKIPDIPEGGLTVDDVNNNITTKLSSYKITTNTIAGKTFHSTETGTLAEGTEYFAINEDGTFATKLKDGTDVELNNDSDRNPTTKETDTSNGPLWQIGWDGSGHLAGGNFRWDTTGNLDIAGKITVGGNTVSDDGENIPGEVNIGSGVGVGPWKTFENGEGVSYIGDADSTDESTNYFGSDGTFKIGGVDGIFKETPDGNVQISSKVEFMGSGGSGDEDNSGLTEKDLNEWWDKTTIDGGKITTGQIDASLINVENLEVEKLNTTPNEETTNGRILISNNDIIVFDSEKENTKVLNITGNSFADLEAVPDEILGSYNIDEIGSKKQNVLFINDRYIKLKIFSITVPDTGYSYKLTITGLTHTGYIVSNELNTQNIDTTYQLYGDFIATMEDTCSDYNKNNSIYSPWAPLKITSGVNEEFDKTSSGIITLSDLHAGTYNIYLSARCPVMTGVNVGNTNIHAGIVVDKGTINTELTPQTIGSSVDGMPLTCIASNGLRFLKSATEYFELDNNGYITYRNGSRGFGCDKSGLWLRYNSINYSISIDESGNIKTTKRS